MNGLPESIVGVPPFPSRYWRPPLCWKGNTVVVIGGGTSLKGFDWSLLRDKPCIGINDAYRWGGWVDVCIFGDDTWFKKMDLTEVLK